MIQISEMVANLGVMIVISALFIYLFWWQSKRQENNFEKLLGYIMTSNRKLDNESYQSQRAQHQEKLKIRINADDKISQKLTEICLQTDSQRVCIFEFHNSIENLCGLPFAKFSTTYEYICKGVEPIANSWQNFPYSMLTPVLSDVYENGYCDINDIEDIPNKGGLLYNMAKTNGVDKLFYSGLFDHKNNLFGLLVLEHENKFKKDDIAKVQDASIFFSTILDASKK